jgi:hypothetical protein
MTAGLNFYPGNEPTSLKGLVATHAARRVAGDELE